MMHLYFKRQWNPRTLAAFIGVLITLVSLTACQRGSKKKDEKPATTPIPDEVSLKVDRTSLEELRQEVPTEVRRENDELAFIRELLTAEEQEPSKIRERFSKAVRDRRLKFDRAAKKRRDDFNRKEKQDRNDFLAKHKDKRDDFVNSSRKIKSEKRKAFFDEQDSQRNGFFGDQRDARKDFESQETEARRTFEAYLTERVNQFNGEIREYTNNFYDRRKNLALKKRTDEQSKEKAMEKTREKTREAGREGSYERSAGAVDVDPDLEQFKTIPKTPGIPLEN
jgi:hypothetical protein